MPIDPNDYNPVDLPEMEWPGPDDPDVSPFASPVELARAKAYAQAKKAGKLDKLPKDWLPDGTLKGDG